MHVLWRHALVVVQCLIAFSNLTVKEIAFPFVVGFCRVVLSKVSVTPVSCETKQQHAQVISCS